MPAPTLPSGTPAPLGRWVAGIECYTDAGGTAPVAALNDDVEMWKDQSGNGYHLTKGAFTAPQFDPAPGFVGLVNGSFPNLNPFGGSGGVKFNGSTQALVNAAIQPCTSNADPITWMVVCKVTGGTRGVAGLDTGGKMSPQVHLAQTGFHSNLPSGGGVFYFFPTDRFCGRGLLVRYDPSQPTVLTKVTLHEFGAAVAGTGSSLPTPGAIAAGLRVGHDGSGYWPGTVLEIAVWNAALTDAQLDALDAYMAATYLKTGFTHIATVGDSIARGYAANQNNDPASYAGDGNSPGLILWHNAAGSKGSLYNGSAVGYGIGNNVPDLFGNISTFISGAIQYRDPWALRDVFIVEGGTNDLGAQQTSAEVIASVKARCDTVNAQGYPRVILWTIPPRGDWPTAGQVEEPLVTAGGSGYSSAPTVSISGSGTGATATATVVSGVVRRIVLTSGGSGYSGAVTVSFSGGGGSGATATSKVSTGSPYGAGTPAGPWTDAKETARQAVNAWIRGSAVAEGYCDAVYDVEAMGVTNPNDGNLYSVDLLHFTNAGAKRHAANMAALLDATAGSALLSA